MRHGFTGLRAALAVALGAAWLAAPVRAAEETTIFGMVLDLPSPAEGWTRKDLSDGVIVQKTFPADAKAGRRRAGAAMIQIAKPVPPSAGPFPAAFARFVDGFQPLAGKRPITKGTGITVNGHDFAFDRRCCGRMNEIGVDAVSVGVAGPSGHRFLKLITLGLSNEDEKPVEAAFEALVRSLRPESGDRAFALVPGAGGKGFEGVYTHLSTGLRPNAFGGMDFYADNEIMMFDPSGLYAREIPKDGMSLADHCRATPTDCGTYRLVGGGLFSSPGRIETREVENRFGMLSREERAFARKGEELVIGETTYRQLAPMPKGTPFEGTWRYFFAQTGSGAFSSNSVAVERTLTFTRDGRFRRTGFSGFSSSTDTGNGTTGLAGSRERPSEQGRYGVEGHALTLTGEDGRSERLSLFLPDKDSDKLLVINGSNYLKRERDQK